MSITRKLASAGVAAAIAGVGRTRGGNAGRGEERHRRGTGDRVRARPLHVRTAPNGPWMKHPVLRRDVPRPGPEQRRLHLRPAVRLA